MLLFLLNGKRIFFCGCLQCLQTAEGVFTLSFQKSFIVDGIVECRGLFRLGREEGITLIEELDACNDDACQEGKLEHTYEATQEAVDPAETDGAEQLRHKPTHQAEEQRRLEVRI